MNSVIKTRILNQLKAGFDTYPGKMRNVAKYIVDHPADFGLDSIRATAAKVGVSTNTLVRLASLLGFDSYDELREPFRQSLLATSEVVSDFDWLNELEKRSPDGARLTEISRNTLAIVHRTLREQDPVLLSDIVDALFEARQVYVTGFRACYGLAYYLYYAGRMALPNMSLAPRQMNSATDEIINGTSEDVVLAVTFSPYSRETIEVCKFARNRGMKLFLIADSTMIAPEIGAEEILVASTHSTHHFECHTGAMALIETLVAMMVHKGGRKAEKRIASYEAARQEIDAYWVQKK